MLLNALVELLGLGAEEAGGRVMLDLFFGNSAFFMRKGDDGVGVFALLAHGLILFGAMFLRGPQFIFDLG